MKNKTGITLTFLMLFYTFFLCNVFAITMDEMYDVKPDPAACNEGVLKNAEKQKVLKKLNVVRKLHGLKPVTYNSADDVLTAKSALIMQANATLTHDPDKSYKCWSEEGKKGSGKSNIHINSYSGTMDLATSESMVESWLIDDGVDSLGHRRWLIDPFLKHISFGRVDGKPVVNSEWETTTGAAISVINDEKADIKDTKIDFVAYPYQSYSNEIFKKHWYLSFTALYDKTSSWNNSDANYANAKITVTDENGSALSVHSVSHDNTGFGVPNIIQWKVKGLQNNVKYAVKISGIAIEGKPKDCTYWFKLSDTLPEKLIAMDATETTTAETNVSADTESKQADCTTFFAIGKKIPFKILLNSDVLPPGLGKMHVDIVKENYMEITFTSDGNPGKIVSYGTLYGTTFMLTSDIFQSIIKGVCDASGAYGKITGAHYGKVDEYYFYAGQRNIVTYREIEKVLLSK